MQHRGLSNPVGLNLGLTESLRTHHGTGGHHPIALALGPRFHSAGSLPKHFEVGKEGC